MNRLISFTLFLSSIVLVQAQTDFPKVYLNHIYIVVDDMTFKEIATSPFMSKRFAAMDEGLPNFKKVSDTSAAVYLYGHNSFIKIISTRNKEGLKEGALGIVFGVEQSGGVKQLYDSLKNKNPNAYYALDSIHPIGKIPFAWKYTTGIEDADSTKKLSYSLVEYHPDFIKNIPGKSAKPGSIKRVDFLKKKYIDESLLNDIEEVSLQINSKEIQPFLDMLKQFQFIVTTKSKEEWIVKANDMVIRIKPIENAKPTLKLLLTVNTPKEITYSFQKSTLILGKNFGTWNFH